MVASSIAVGGFEHRIRQITGLGVTGDPRPLAR